MADEKKKHATNDPTHGMSAEAAAAYWRGRAEAAEARGGAPAPESSLPPMDDVSVYCATFPEKAAEERRRAEMMRAGVGLPFFYVLAQLISTGARVCYFAQESAEARRTGDVEDYKIVRYDLPPQFVGKVAAVANHPEALLVTAKDAVAKLGDVARAQQVLLMEQGLYRQENSSFTYSEIASKHKAMLGRGSPGSQDRYVRLTKPIHAPITLRLRQARRLFSYCQILPPNAESLPEEWLALLDKPLGLVDLPGDEPAPLTVPRSQSDAADPMLAELRASVASDGRGSSSVGKPPSVGPVGVE